MKALSVRQRYASQIASGEKTIEYRSWETRHRGSLLIVSTKHPHFEDVPCGYAIAVVQLVDCHQASEGVWEWVLAHPKPITPFRVKGHLGIYEVQWPQGAANDVK